MANLVIDRITKLLDEHGMEAMIVLSPESVVYAAGVHVVSQRMIRERLLFTVIPRKGEPFVVISNVVEPTVRLHSWIKDIEMYREHYDTPIGRLAEALKKRDIVSGRVWAELDFLPARDYVILASALPGLEFVDCESILNQLRVQKTPAEIEFLTSIVRKADEAMRYGFMLSKCGDTELTVADLINEGHIRLGADGVYFRILGAGPVNSRKPFNEPGSKRLEPGDVVYTDYVAFFQGYYSDIARMAVVGKPSSEQRDIYAIVRKAQRAVIGGLRPGMAAEEAYALGEAQMAKSGYKLQMRSVGHSLGVIVHEHPNLVPGCKDILQSGSIINVELNLSLEGLGKFHLEDTVLLGDEGATLLTDRTDTEEMYVIR